MKVYETKNIRNVAVLGHGDAGKTSLVSALLFAAGATPSKGSVDAGTSVTDFAESEHERKVSMSLGVAHAEWKECKINFLDAPGYSNFIGEAAGAIRGCDVALIVVHGVDGMGVQTERMWEDAEKAGLPVMFAVTHLDRERADFDAVVQQLIDRFGRHVVPVSFPIGSGPSLEGVINLVTGQAVRPTGDGSDVERVDAPQDLKERVAGAREELTETVAESDDELMEAYLEEGSLTDDQFDAGLNTSVRNRALFPVMAVSSETMVGATTVLSACVSMGADPGHAPPLVASNEAGEEMEIAVDSNEKPIAQVIKTYVDPFAGRISVFKLLCGTLHSDQMLWNVDRSCNEKMSGMTAPMGKEGTKVTQLHAGDIAFVSKLKETRTGDTLVPDKSISLKAPPIPFPKPVIAFAVHSADEGGDEEKIAGALARLAEEDQTLKLDRDPRSHELMLSGLGMDHAAMVLEKMERRYKVKAALQKPKVPYLETITKPASGMYRHKKQSGGSGQFAEVHMKIEPLPRGGGFEYGSEIVGGAISRNFWPSIEKGVKQIMEGGVIAGYPLVDIKAVIFDGKEHPVDSKDIAFQIAGRHVFMSCVREARPVVLEPMMSVIVVCPEECMGDVLGDLSRHRGKPEGNESSAGRVRITATVPLEEMLDYAARLRAMTSDRGNYEMSMSHYEKVPAEKQKELMAAFAQEQSED